MHPFTISFSSADVRITSRFRQDEWYQGLAGTVHETGHAIYESNLNADAASINSALSMGVHESQSLFWERHVGLSQPFWKCWGAKVRELMGVSASDEEIYRAVNHVNQVRPPARAPPPHPHPNGLCPEGGGEQGCIWKGGTPPSSRAPSLRPATVPLTANASFNAICNRQ